MLSFELHDFNVRKGKKIKQRGRVFLSREEVQDDMSFNG